MLGVKDFNINIVNIAPGDFKTDIVKRRIDSFNIKILYTSTNTIDYGKMNDHVEKAGSDPKIAELVYKIIGKKKPKYIMS